MERKVGKNNSERRGSRPAGKTSASDRARMKVEDAAPTGKEAVTHALGLFLGGLAVFLLVSLAFYVFTWAEDQSLLSEKDIFTSFVDVENSGGVLGFLWSNILVSKFFGFGAFVIPFFLGALSLYFLKIRTFRLKKLIVVTLFGTVVFSLVFSYLFSFTPFDDFFGTSAGGSYGYYVTRWLINAVGVLGTGLLLLFMLAVWCILLNRRVINVFNGWLDRISRSVDERILRKAEKAVAEKAACETASEECPEGSDVDCDDADTEENFGSEGTDIVVSADAQECGDDSLEEVIPAEESTAAGMNVELESPENDVPCRGNESGYVGFSVEGMDAGQVQSAGEDGGNALPENISVREGHESECMSSDTHMPEGYGFEHVDTEDVHESDDSDSGNGGEKNAVTASPVQVINEEEDFLAGLSEESLSTLFDPRLDLPRYKAPELDLLESYSDKVFNVSYEELEKNNRNIVSTLNNFQIEVKKVSAMIGPTVTLYQVVPAPGVRVSRIKNLEADIARSLAAKGVRVIDLPGTTAIGIEVANERPSVVSMKSVLSDRKFIAVKDTYALPIVIGRTISNEPYMFDLAKMPHLLVAGATGQGKSVGLNAIITSLLYTKHPSELKFVLVDPKKVELSLYSRLEKHFLAMLPDGDDAIITETRKVVNTLRSLCIEMDTRYDLLKSAKVRSVKEYNAKFLSRRLNPNKGHHYMPYIVVIIDEFADLLMTAGREVEEPIARLAQLARAIGIHLVIATQRPTTNIITGSIKANFPARIAFRVISSVDSRTILDQVGANQLIGRGDMLIYEGSDLTRVQCALVDTEEVERISEFIGSQMGYTTPYYLPEYVDEEQESRASDVDLRKRDKLFEDAARLVVSTQQGSTSMLQRKMNVGFPKAGRLMDQLEAAGIVGPYEGSKSRRVLISDFNALDELLKTL